MLMRSLLVFASLLVGHFVTTYCCAIVAFDGRVGVLADVVGMALFAPALLSDMTGAGVVPHTDGAFFGGPLGMWVNSLLWVTPIWVLWLLWRWAFPRGRQTSHSPGATA